MTGGRRVKLPFILSGAKRVFDSRPIHAQIDVMDDCNLSCQYCSEYAPGTPAPPLQELKQRIDKLDSLGVFVYDFRGGEPLLHPGIVELVAHTKHKRNGANLVTIITNGFLLKSDLIRDLNNAGLDCLQVSVDSIEPTPTTPKSLKSLLPKLRLLAREARFDVKIQTTLYEETYADYDRFREVLKDFPFTLRFSPMHHPGGRIAIQGEKYVAFLRKYGVSEAGDFWDQQLEEMLMGDFSRPWKCLGGFKSLFINSKGGMHWCCQQRDYVTPLQTLSPAELRKNNCHKPCEAGCCIGYVRVISNALGEPTKTFAASLRMALQKNRQPSIEQSPVPG